MMQPSHAKVLFYGSLFILFIFTLGLFAPLLFDEQPKNAGAFGDGFGWVSALFNGFGFLALSYTIYLQIDARVEEKQKEDFNFLYNHLTVIEKNFDDFHFKGREGMNALSEVIKYIQDYGANPEHDAPMHHLFQLVKSVEGYRNMLIAKINVFHRDQYFILRGRYIAIETKYLRKFEDMPINRKQLGTICQITVHAVSSLSKTDHKLFYPDERPFDDRPVFS